MAPAPLANLHHLSHLHSQQTITASPTHKLSSISQGRINSFLQHPTTPSLSSKSFFPSIILNSPSSIHLSKGILDTSSPELSQKLWLLKLDIHLFVASLADLSLTLVTRTEKHNDRNHSGLADGTASSEDHLPRYFAKSGHVGEDPKKVKKEGAGKGNWWVESEPIS